MSFLSCPSCLSLDSTGSFGSISIQNIIRPIPPPSFVLIRNPISSLITTPEGIFYRQACIGIAHLDHLSLSLSLSFLKALIFFLSLQPKKKGGWVGLVLRRKNSRTISLSLSLFGSSRPICLYPLSRIRIIVSGISILDRSFLVYPLIREHLFSPSPLSLSAHDGDDSFKIHDADFGSSQRSEMLKTPVRACGSIQAWIPPPGRFSNGLVSRSSARSEVHPSARIHLIRSAWIWHES